MAKKSFREQMAENDAAQRLWGAMYGKEVPEHLLNNLPPKRKYTKGASGEPSEAEILKAVMQLVRTHPKVAMVWRQNSGQFEVGSGMNKRYVRANSAKGMADVMGTLKNGGRILAIEIKSKRGVIHAHQQKFIDEINAAGGLGFFARSVDDVIEKLREA